MDHGRYAPQHGRESNSALDGYGVINEPDFRAGGSYNGRRFVDEGFPTDSHGRGAFCQDVHDRNMYPQPPYVGTMWSQHRRNRDEQHASARDYRRHDTDYCNDGKHHEFDSYRGVDRLCNNYRVADNHYESGSYCDFGVDRNKRIGSRDRAEFHGEFEDRYRSSHQSREDSCERDREYGRYSYDLDYEEGRRDSSWRRHDSCESEYERRGLSRERDENRYRRHSRSRSRGRDDRSISRSRSRSPRGKSRGRNRRDGFYDDNRFDKRREYDWDERRHGDLVAPSATVVVKGLSQKTNEDDLYRILVQVPLHELLNWLKVFKPVKLVVKDKVLTSHLTKWTRCSDDRTIIVATMLRARREQDHSLHTTCFSRVHFEPNVAVARDLRRRLNNELIGNASP